MDFYVYIPAYGAYFSNNFMERLAEKSIKSFGYKMDANFLNQVKHRMNILGDGHWTKLGNDFHSALIAHHLKSQGY